MAVTAKATRASLSLDLGDTGSFTVSGLNPSAAADSLYTLAQGINAFQDTAFTDLTSTVEFELINQ
jgi:hypothetical protein